MAEQTIEERFPVGSRWRNRAGTYLAEVLEHGRNGEAIAVRTTLLNGEVLTERGWWAIDGFDDMTLLADAPPRPTEPPKPAVMCEAVGWLGAAHALAADEYGVCRVCKCTSRERVAARRRVFDACATCEWMTPSMLIAEDLAAYNEEREGATQYLSADEQDAVPRSMDMADSDTNDRRITEPVMGMWIATEGEGTSGADGLRWVAAPTRELAIEALWQKLEAKREVAR